MALDGIQMKSANLKANGMESYAKDRSKTSF